MKILIELVGFLGESGLPTGFSGGELEVADGLKLEELMTLQILSNRIPLFITVNGQRASLSVVLRDNDIIRFVPLVGGG